MIKRENLLNAIDLRLKESPIVALLGARQVGKTTLAKLYGEKLDRHAWHYFDLEDPRDQARLSQPQMALEDLGGLIVLDEIQRVPELFPILRVLADDPNTKNRFMVLGSASPELMRQVSESLAGRIAFVDVGGFHQRELTHDCRKDLWWRGGFPRAFLASSDSFARRWHLDFFRTFLERDIPQLGLSIPAYTLRRFWTMIAHYHGQIIRFSELARSMSISEPTAKRYVEILTGTFMVRLLPPWFENLKKRQVKSPKVYLRDSGIFHALIGIESRDALLSHPKLGASWEAYCMEQILTLVGSHEAYFWATHAGAELDLLLFRKGKRLGVEFKYMDAPRMTPSMKRASEDLKLDKLLVVYPGSLSFPLDRNMDVLSLEVALKILESYSE